MAGIGQTVKAAFRLCTAVHELNHLCGHKEEFPRGKSTGKPEQKKRSSLGAARIKQHKNVFRKRRSFGYAVSPFCRSISKDAGSIPTRS